MKCNLLCIFAEAFPQGSLFLYFFHIGANESLFILIHLTCIRNVRNKIWIKYILSIMSKHIVKLGDM